MATKNRNFGLDALRSSAIAAVLVFHGYLGFYVSTGLSPWQGWRAALSASSGVLSLEWFFVLSGFLIGSILIRSFETGGGWWASARAFWLRRWFRTLPNYYLFLLVNALLVWWQVAEGRFAWSFVVFSQSLAWPQSKPFFYSESWSLAIEEWFYFLVPCLLGLVALLFRRLERKHLFWLAAAVLILVPTLLRIGATPPTHFFDWDEHVRRVTIKHLDSIGWGVAAAIVNRWYPDWWARRKGHKALVGLALILANVAAMTYFMGIDWRGFAGGRFNDLALITAPALGTALLLPWIVSCHAPSQAVGKWIRRVADYSYSMYLCHFPILHLLLYILRVRGWEADVVVGWMLILWLVLVFGVSALVFHRFERPLTGLRDRFARPVPAGPFVGRASLGSK